MHEYLNPVRMQFGSALSYDRLYRGASIPLPLIRICDK
jgi:hypothetical protein